MTEIIAGALVSLAGSIPFESLIGNRTEAAETPLGLKLDADFNFTLIYGVKEMRLLAVVLVASVFCLLAVADAHAHVTYVAYDPCCSPPVVMATFYAPAPAVVYPSTTAVRSRYRPLLGGSVTRVRYVDAPVVYASPWCCW
jgi:hypothetical protein